MPRILIVDDDQETCRFMKELLARPGRDIELAHDPDTALAMAARAQFDLVISDINLNARLTGLDVLRAFKAKNPEGQVLLISGFGSLETAIDAVRNGAFDFISKPFNIGEVKAVVERALEQTLADPQPGRPPRDVQPAGLVGRSPTMLSVYKQIARAADTTAPVLIIGESGTGKELVARAVHAHGQRAARAFVAINCGAIAETLLESELFGHVRGSFTGAITDTKGLFEQGHLGTVFLDEIGETSPGLQVKLLRVLEENEVRPVGGHRPIRVDIRIVAATNSDIEKAVTDGRFRTDLYYRLGVITITMPPLRDRREDIPLLTEGFLRNACSRAQRNVADLGARRGRADHVRLAWQRARTGEHGGAARGVQPRFDDRRRGPAADAAARAPGPAGGPLPGPALARRAGAPLPAACAGGRGGQSDAGRRGARHRSPHAVPDGRALWDRVAGGLKDRGRGRAPPGGRHPRPRHPPTWAPRCTRRRR